MSKYQVVTTLKVRTRTGTVREILPGETITLTKEMAGPLLEAGRIRGVVPYLESGGGLVIPFGSDSRYHWWNGGQLPSKTEEEIRTWLH